ncbi:hypothetical protein F5Y03DRAFT_385568 [Xylaria venustula]|nr:hypothetical protein F5Y03DRAFT_385568 [Xylaria venustula]
MLCEASLLNGITSDDPRILMAFNAVDTTICGRGSNPLRRLAYVHLMRLFDSLKDIIKSDRDNGRIHREPYYRDANIAMDIFLNAQRTQSNTMGWSDLAAPSPLFVLVYSDAAEAIVKGFKKADNHTLSRMVTKILRICPSQIVDICARLAKGAETAAKSSGFVDMIPFSAAQTRQNLALWY